MRYLIHHLVADALASHGERIAIEQGEVRVTYAQLDARAWQWAHVFAEHGLGKGERIGILSHVRHEAIAAMIGALRAGVVYVPLNVHAPVAWLGNVVRSANLTTVLADSFLATRAAGLTDFGVRRILPLSGDTLRGANSAPLPWDAAPLADDIAYVLYTSGSTGDPKGILITHRNACSFIAWMGEEFCVGASDRVLSRAPLQFDLSVFDIFTTIACGACLVIAPPERPHTPHDVVTLMRERRITMIYTVPSAYIGMLSKGGLERGIPSLRQLMYAGEPFATAYLRGVMGCLPNTRVSNIYGPTETNIVTYYHIDSIPEADEPVPIGRPVQDCEAYIVDDELRRLPDGEIGEILIRGSTVFAGYFNSPELTRKKLVQSPFHAHPTLCCRTGDYGRILPDGNIAYHGRMDNMIKTRGYRVELGEVEAAVSRCPNVSEAAVVPKRHAKYGHALYAFVVLKDGSAADVQQNLSETLPSYMLPYDIATLPELPKTATGKVDRVRLERALHGE